MLNWITHKLTGSTSYRVFTHKLHKYIHFNDSDVFVCGPGFQIFVFDNPVSYNEEALAGFFFCLFVLQQTLLMSCFLFLFFFNVNV